MKINVKTKKLDESIEKDGTHVNIEIKNPREFLKQYAGSVVYIYFNPIDISADPIIKIENKATFDVELKFFFDINNINKILQLFQEQYNTAQVRKTIQEASISLLEFSKSINFSLTIPNNEEFLQKHVGKKTHIDLSHYDPTSKPKIEIESDPELETESTSKENIKVDTNPESEEPELDIELTIDNEFANKLDGLRNVLSSLGVLNTSDTFNINLGSGSSHKYETKSNAKQPEPITDPKLLNKIQQIRKEMLESVNDTLKWTMQLVSLHVPEKNDQIEEMLSQLENYRLNSKPEKDKELEKIRLKRIEVVNNNLKTVKDIIRSATEQISRIQEWKQDLKVGI